MDANMVQAWETPFNALFDGPAGAVFRRGDLRRRAQDYVRGLLGSVERKNCWQLAEHLGHERPFGVQRLLGRASWDADQLRDQLIGYATDHLGKEQTVLIVDETGFLKKGTHSVGVQRQYSGTAGRIENCQVGVFLAIATAKGHALIDRALYMPELWCNDPIRRHEAGVPEEVTFATKPQLAVQMIGRALDQGIQADFVLADEVYGNDGKLRRFLEKRSQAYVLAVRCDHRLEVNQEQQRVDQIAEIVPADAWFRYSVADGSKGPRVYDWCVVKFGEPTAAGHLHWLLIRRHIRTGERAYYLCCAPAEVSAQDLAQAAGRRWAIEVCFECAKQQTGLDGYEVRSWDGWHRHITLSMLAAAFLTVIRIAATAQCANPQRVKKTSHRRQAAC